MIKPMTPNTTTAISGPELARIEKDAPVLKVSLSWKKSSMTTIGPSASSLTAHHLVI